MAGNHFVPQAYMKSWARENQQVFAYPTAFGGEVVSPHTRNIGTEKGLYPDTLEKDLNIKVEVPMLPLIEKINSGFLIEKKDKLVIATYFHSLIERSPWAAQYVKLKLPEIGCDVQLQVESALERKFPNSVPVEAVEAVKQAIRNAVDAPENKIWHQALQPDRASKAVERLSLMNMAVFSAPAGKHFLTSDRPAMRPLDRHFAGNDLYLLPVGPKKILAISNSVLVDHSVRNSDVVMINMRIAAEADRWVISSSPDSWIRKFIDKHRARGDKSLDNALLS